MKVKNDTWKYFKVSDVMHLIKCKKYSSIPDSPGKTAFVSSSAENNGVVTFCDEEPTISVNCITVSTNGECFSAFFHEEPICISTDVEAFTSPYLNAKTAYFLCTVLELEKPKWCYGRKPKNNKVGDTLIKLPAKIIKGKYVVAWDYIEDFVSIFLKTKKITTKIKNHDQVIDTSNWREFKICELFNTQMGTGIDAILTTSYNPKFNYVSRDSNGNGVVARIDEIDGKTPFEPGVMTLALGGSFLGSCFVQKEPFYTAQNVGILKEKIKLSVYTKIFICSLIRNECRIKYQAFGRELNSHFRKDLSIKLPVLMDKGEPIIDEGKVFSKKGYIPDWKYMDDFVKALRYSDKI